MGDNLSYGRQWHAASPAQQNPLINPIIRVLQQDPRALNPALQMMRCAAHRGGPKSLPTLLLPDYQLFLLYPLLPRTSSMRRRQELCS